MCRGEAGARLTERARHPMLALEEDVPEVRAWLEALAAAAARPDDDVARLVHVAHILEWKYLEGLPVSAIAARLKTTPKAAESLLTRAREAFRAGFAALTTPLSLDR